MTPRSHETEPRLVSGEGVELDVRVARVGSRVPALLLDIAVQVILYMTLSSVAVFIGAFVAVGGLADETFFVALYGVILLIVVVGYPVTLETLTKGRTLGKLAFGLRVVRDDGGPIRFRHALTRGLVGVALEWPGLVLPLISWVASLWTMIANPYGKRLGDLAAGTLVIHERTPAAFGWMPTMPPALAAWARTLDLAGLDDELALAVSHFLARNRKLREPARSTLGHRLALEVASQTNPPPPPGTPGWAYLAAVLAERRRRAVQRLEAARTRTALLWTDVPPLAGAPRR